MIKSNFIKAFACLALAFFCASSPAQTIEEEIHDVNLIFKNKKKEKFVYGDENFGVLLTQYRKGRRSLVMLEPYRDGESSGTRIARTWYKKKYSATKFYTPQEIDSEAFALIRVSYGNFAIIIDEDPIRLSMTYKKTGRFTPGELDWAIYTDEDRTSFHLHRCDKSTGKHCNPDFGYGYWREDYGYFQGVFALDDHRDEEVAGYASIDKHTKYYGLFADGSWFGQLNAVFYDDHPTEGTAMLVGQFDYEGEAYGDYVRYENGQYYVVFLDDREEEVIEKVRITEYIIDHRPLGR